MRALGVVVALAAAAPACGGESHATEASQSDAAEPVCPATPAGASGVACAKDGMVCSDVFSCGAFVQQETCTCVEGRFACTEEGSSDAAAGTTSRCASHAAPDESPCPDSMKDGQGSACSVIGRSCFYEGQRCADGIVRLNYCECRWDEESGALAYDCHVVPCPPQ